MYIDKLQRMKDKLGYLEIDFLNCEKRHQNGLGQRTIGDMRVFINLTASNSEGLYRV
jgi:hypothetical protein